MPRRSRLIVPDIPLHIIQRGNNRQDCFFDDDDYQFYLNCLQEYAHITQCSIHAYVLMVNHVHLLLTPHKQESAGQLMKRVGQRYVQTINRKYQRSGTLWEGRFRSSITQEENYLLNCQRYIELNPVRAGMVTSPGDYTWSSYQSNALGLENKLLRPHVIYRKLGMTEQKQQKNYRKLFRSKLKSEVIDDIRKMTNGNYVLGNERFKEEIGKMLGRRVTPGKAGRPPMNTN